MRFFWSELEKTFKGAITNVPVEIKPTDWPWNPGMVLPTQNKSEASLCTSCINSLQINHYKLCHIPAKDIPLHQNTYCDMEEGSSG